MIIMRKQLMAALATLVAIVLAGCGGGGGGGGSTSSMQSLNVGPPPVAQGTNVLPITVEQGPGNIPDIMYTSVTICAAGTNNCQTVDHVQVDTGSVGVRILASALPLNFWQQLKPILSGSSPYAECTLFADGYSWGPMALADVQMAGETASSLPVQIIGDSTVASTLPPVPAACDQQSPGASEDTPSRFGANGIIGIGSPLQDCGVDCATTLASSNYFTCTSSTSSGSCQPATMPVATQSQNPVAKVAGSNTNGTVITLPSLPLAGATSAQGYLIFGIGTSNNNILGTGVNVIATTTQAQAGANFFTTGFLGINYPRSYVDSGTSIFQVPETNAQIPVCGNTSNAPGYFCPSGPQNYTASMTGANNIAVQSQFTIANASSLASTGNVFALDDLGAPSYPTSSTDNTTAVFAWGAPFFFGKQVFTALEGATVPGTSVAPPFVAF